MGPKRKPGELTSIAIGCIFAYFFSKKIKYHLDYRTLWAHRSDLKCKRLLLTHMSEDCLARLDEIEMEHVEDGQTIVLE